MSFRSLLNNAYRDLKFDPQCFAPPPPKFDVQCNKCGIPLAGHTELLCKREEIRKIVYEGIMQASGLTPTFYFGDPLLDEDSIKQCIQGMVDLFKVMPMPWIGQGLSPKIGKMINVRKPARFTGVPTPPTVTKVTPDPDEIHFEYSSLFSKAAFMGVDLAEKNSVTIVTEMTKKEFEARYPL